MRKVTWAHKAALLKITEIIDPSLKYLFKRFPIVAFPSTKIYSTYVRGGLSRKYCMRKCTEFYVKNIGLN